MQQDDIKQDDDANAHASRSHDKPMNDKHDDARRMAEQLIAEEGHAPRGSAASDAHLDPPGCTLRVDRWPESLDCPHIDE
jgi:hypothetical protein